MGQTSVSTLPEPAGGEWRRSGAAAHRGEGAGGLLVNENVGVRRGKGGEKKEKRREGVCGGGRTSGTSPSSTVSKPPIWLLWLQTFLCVSTYLLEVSKEYASRIS